jgi:hypothetical protein
VLQAMLQVLASQIGMRCFMIAASISVFSHQLCVYGAKNNSLFLSAAYIFAAS